MKIEIEKLENGDIVVAIVAESPQDGKDLKEAVLSTIATKDETKSPQQP